MAYRIVRRKLKKGCDVQGKMEDEIQKVRSEVEDRMPDCQTPVTVKLVGLTRSCGPCFISSPWKIINALPEGLDSCSGNQARGRIIIIVSRPA
jgi:hypothetical protein